MYRWLEFINRFKHWDVSISRLTSAIEDLFWKCYNTYVVSRWLAFSCILQKTVCFLSLSLEIERGKRQVSLKNNAKKNKNLVPLSGRLLFRTSHHMQWHHVLTKHECNFKLLITRWHSGTNGTMCYALLCSVIWRGRDLF